VIQTVNSVLADLRLQRAFQSIAQNESEIEADQIRFTLVPAPPFGEAERARVFTEELRRLDLRPVTDAIGNVVAPYQNSGLNPVVIAAHLDTVFPASTPLELGRRGSVLCLPGIADNSSGIVALLWVLRAARDTGMRFERPVIAIGTVGEEGEGNLRGIRHIFNAPPWEGRTCDFIAVDVGSAHRITNQALGSRRFRIRMKGPGGHSWADFGKPNPIHTICAAIYAFTNNDFVGRPGVSFNFGVLRSGISVNAIPSSATAEVDLRSTASANMDDMEAHLRNAVAVAAGAGGLEWRIESMGERPAGCTPPETPLVRAAEDITQRLGIQPQLDIGSTDANIPMSLGIPAIAVGAGGLSGGVHTTDEWFDPANRTVALQRLLALVAVLAGLR